MKIKFKRFYTFILAIAILNCMFFSTTSFSANANEIISQSPYEQYASPVFNVDPTYALKVQQKQQAAENYYQASISGNVVLANQYKSEFERISNPVLYQSRISQAQARNNMNNTLPTYWRIMDLFQVPQEKTYWCGCAAAKSILDNIGIVKTQTELASNTYLKTEQHGNTPWYLTNGNEYSQFPMATTLLNAQYEVGNSAYAYVPSPLGAAGSNPLTVEQCKTYVMATTSAFEDGYGVAACGYSKNVYGYQLPGYPNANIGHWIVSDGYDDDGDTIYIVDPAKSPCISWQGNISRYYTISATLFRNFVEPRGIIW